MSISLTKTFSEALQKGFDATKAIMDPKDKALAYAHLAQAIAMTGLVEGGTDTTNDAEVPVEKETKAKSKKNTNKDSLKADAGKGSATKEVVEEVEAEIIEENEEEPVVEEIVEEIVEETAEEATEEEIEIDDEWTDEMINLKAAQLDLLNQYSDAWTEEYVFNDCVTAWSEGTFSGKDSIRPTNIDGFLTYLEQISESAE